MPESLAELHRRTIFRGMGPSAIAQGLIYSRRPFEVGLERRKPPPFSKRFLARAAKKMPNMNMAGIFLQVLVRPTI